MKKPSIIRIAAAAAGALLIVAGCALRLDPEEEAGGKAIGFSAGSPLLRDDVTKGTIIESTSFPDGSQLHVWAWHSAASQHLTFGGTTKVHLSGGVWDYAPHQFWNWKTGDDYYDFLAVYPGNRNITHQAASVAQPQLNATVNYDALTDQYDLMGAGLRRTEKLTTTVPLEFRHLLSAVSLTVKNSSSSVDALGNPKTITFKSCRFVNLVTGAPVTISFDGNALASQNGIVTRSASAALGLMASASLTPGSSYPAYTSWDIMLPQDLRTESIGNPPPYLEIVYNDGTQDVTMPPVYLKDIKDSFTKEEITSWEAGRRYKYEIEIKLGGGILVIVSTTPWEVVEAETPGLMI